LVMGRARSGSQVCQSKLLFPCLLCLATFFPQFPFAHSTGWSANEHVLGNNSVGKFVVAALRHPEAAYGKALKVQSLVTTPDAILQEFEKQTSSKWAVEYTPLDRLRELERQTWQAGKPYATGFTLRRIWAEGGTLYDKTDNEALEVKDEDLESLSTVVGRAVRGEGW